MSRKPHRAMRWGWLIVPPALFSGGLLIFTQLVFLQASFHADEGLGVVAGAFTWDNYRQVWRDPDYLASLALTLRLAAFVVCVTMVMAWPVAYMLSRGRPRLAMAIIAAIIATSFLTLPIKTLGMVILFTADGPLMRALHQLGLVSARYRFVGSFFAVALGYTHLAISFMVTMLFSVFQAIPPRLEEAARILGAGRVRVLWRVVLPLSLPGTISATLVLFNLLTGAFVSAALLGGGKILTLPLLIQRSLVLFNEYGMAATLAVVLLAIGLAVNVASVMMVTRWSSVARVIT
jgi:putative spermidine/putrescine transport system permease protein